MMNNKEYINYYLHYLSNDEVNTIAFLINCMIVKNKNYNRRIKQKKTISKLKEYWNDDKNFEILDLYSQSQVDRIQQDLLNIIGSDD